MIERMNREKESTFLIILVCNLCVCLCVLSVKGWFLNQRNVLWCFNMLHSDQECCFNEWILHFPFLILSIFLKVTQDSRKVE